MERTCVLCDFLVITFESTSAEVGLIGSSIEIVESIIEYHKNYKIKNA